MMYFFEALSLTAMRKDAQEELDMGRRHNASERAAQNKKAGWKITQREVEQSTTYTGHRQRLCDRADDQGLLHDCNDTWLEVRTWNNDIRGVMTLFGVAVYWMFWGWVVAGDWIDVISLYLYGHRANGSFLKTTTPLFWLANTILTTLFFFACSWVLHRYFLRYELFTQRWIRLRFNRKTKKVYLQRPKYAGGLMECNWLDLQPTLPKTLDPEGVWLIWPAVGWEGKKLGEPTIMQFIGRRTSFKTNGDWMAFWEYIRRYMEEGPDAVPQPQRLIGYGPSPREAWLSVTQWYPQLQSWKEAEKSPLAILISPLILLITVSNFIGQCLTWQARFPKEIENAGWEA